MNIERNKAQDLIKLVAIFSMVIDHLRYVFPEYQNILVVFGRWAFPLFVFLIATNTYRAILSDNKKTIKSYFINLILFSIISEIPYRLLAGSTGSVVTTINVIPTLLFGFLLILLISKENLSLYIKTFLLIPLLTSIYLITDLLEYGIYGVLLMPLLFCFISSKKPIHRNIFFTISIFLAIISNLQYFIPIIKLYGFLNIYTTPICISIVLVMLFLKKIQSIKINISVFKIGKLFWWFYPIHMILLYLIVRITQLNP